MTIDDSAVIKTCCKQAHRNKKKNTETARIFLRYIGHGWSTKKNFQLKVFKMARNICYL